jgi:lactobin A/cerein 7B family class IIb bacteriocin
MIRLQVLIIVFLNQKSMKMYNQALEIQNVPAVAGLVSPALMQKRTVSELTENEMIEVDGGLTPLAAAVGIAAGAAAIGYYCGKALYYATH